MPFLRLLYQYSWTIVVECLALLLRIWKVPGSNLDPNSLSEESRVQMNLREPSYVIDITLK
jgi:hypothetical protein